MRTLEWIGSILVEQVLITPQVVVFKIQIQRQKQNKNTKSGRKVGEKRRSLGSWKHRIGVKSGWLTPAFTESTCDYTFQEIKIKTQWPVRIRKSICLGWIVFPTPFFSLSRSMHRLFIQTCQEKKERNNSEKKWWILGKVLRIKVSRKKQILDRWRKWYCYAKNQLAAILLIHGKCVLCQNTRSLIRCKQTEQFVYPDLKDFGKKVLRLVDQSHMFFFRHWHPSLRCVDLSSTIMFAIDE